MLVKERHPKNAQSPILVTPSRMAMLVKEPHPKNAQSPILVTPSGMAMLVKEVQKQNVLLVDYQYYTL